MDYWLWVTKSRQNPVSDVNVWLFSDCRGPRTTEWAFLRLLQGAVPRCDLHRGDEEEDTLLRSQPPCSLCRHLHPCAACLPPARRLRREGLSGWGLGTVCRSAAPICYCLKQTIIWIYSVLHSTNWLFVLQSFNLNRFGSLKKILSSHSLVFIPSEWCLDSSESLVPLFCSKGWLVGCLAG